MHYQDIMSTTIRQALHEYIDTDVRLDPEHDNLPREQVFEIEEQVIANRV